MNKELILERVEALCDEKGISQTTAFTESGVGKNFKSNLKTSNPSEGKLTMLANYFGVSVKYLKGETDQKNLSELPLSPHEQSLLSAYRAQPELQIAVDRILGIELDGYIRLYSAAHSEDNRPDEITYMRKDRWETIKNTPDTDEPLT